MPHKIKHFIWRACHNALPTKCNLVRRSIVNSEVCELCNEGQEDVIHALWRCPVVENVWSYHSWAQQAVNPPPLTFCDLFDRFVQVTDDFRKEFFVVAAWCIWNRRNALHFGRQVQPISNINLLASNLLQEFLAAQEDVAPTPLASVNQHQWRPPEQDHFKVNFDAALFQSINRAGIGVVIRDWRGEVVAALSMPTALASSVADLEALACRRALLFAAEKELQKVIFEGDSVSVMKAIVQEHPVLTSYGDIVDDIHDVASTFQSAQFVSVHRACNMVADALAKKAKGLAETREWLGDLPSDIAQLVVFDVP